MPVILTLLTCFIIVCYLLSAVTLVTNCLINV